MISSIRKNLFAATLATAALVAMPLAAADLAAVSAHGGGLAWMPRGGHQGLVLTVAGGDVWQRHEFRAGETPTFDAAGLADGTYKWELVAVSKARSRRGGDAGASAAPGRVQSGSFTVVNGAVADPNLVEATAGENRRRDGATRISGDLVASGAKSFVAPDPADSERAIYYVALEGPEAGTYYRGNARTAHGRAVIELPEHFAKVTETEGLTVQVTPLGGWSGLYVAEMTPARLVVRDAEARDGVEFSFLVQGVRKGYANFEVVRPAAPDGQN